jgi:FAD/FMN-containing dehydrogenase
MLTHAAPLPGYSTPSAWPPTRDFALMPCSVWYGWNDSVDDAVLAKATKASSDKLRAYAVAQGDIQASPKYPGSSKYPNFAALWTEAKEIWGLNLSRMKAIKAKYDPANVMNLTGGFKV